MLKQFIKRGFPGIVRFYYAWRKERKLFNKYRRALKQDELFVPKDIFIEVTNHCNARCIMCPHLKLTRPKGYMPWEVFAKIIEDCKSFEGSGLNIILHKDGEPLLDPMLFQRIEYIKKNLLKSSVSFASNAALLDREKNEALLKSGLDSVIFSVDGASAGTYEKIRQGLDYETVKNTLDNFFELKAKSGSRIFVTMQMVVCAENKHEIEEYNRLWSGRANEVYFKAMHNFYDMGTSIKTKQHMRFQLRFCSAPFHMMVIYWTGEVGLCCWDYDNMIKLGNVMGKPMLDIYNNVQFKKIRHAMCAKNCAGIIPCNKCSQIYGFDMDMDFYNE